MAESRFIKTVTFGGYDKNDVDKKLEYLFTQVYELKNELRVTKLRLDEYRKGTDEEKAHETILAAERAKLTQVQVQNETMSEKFKTIDDDNKQKETLIAELKAELEKTTAAKSEAESKLAALSAGSDAAALSTVFIEAQKSAKLLEDTARAKAKELEADVNKLSENTIDEANNKAKKIIFEAETRAAEIDAEAKNKSEQMDAASDNLRATLLADVERFTAEVEKLKGVFDAFQQEGIDKLGESEKLLKSADESLRAGGVPEFREPKRYEPEYPEAPEYKKVTAVYASGASEADKKKKEELEKLAAMAASIDGGSAPKADAPASGGIDLAALAAPAAALADGDEKKEEAPKASGGIDLAALAAQAAALED